MQTSLLLLVWMKIDDFVYFFMWFLRCGIKDKRWQKSLIINNNCILGVECDQRRTENFFSGLKNFLTKIKKSFYPERTWPNSLLTAAVQIRTSTCVLSVVINTFRSGRNTELVLLIGGLPPLEEFVLLLQKVVEDRHLTNDVIFFESSVNATFPRKSWMSHY